MGKHDFYAALKIAEECWQGRIAAADMSHHPTTKGDLLEHAWRDLLRETLPSRYKVSAGFVISADNEISQQIDCVVYDNTFTPTFFSEHRLAYIPAEAVYAVCEIKPTVNKGSILYAAEKVKSVRSLRRTSAPYTGDGKERPAKEQFHVIGGLLARDISNWSHHKKLLDKKQLSKTEALDIVWTANKGGADYFRWGARTDPKITIYPPPGGLMVSVIRLVQALLKQGTVPAVDWDDWLCRLGRQGIPKKR